MVKNETDISKYGILCLAFDVHADQLVVKKHNKSLEPSKLDKNIRGTTVIKRV